MLLLRNVLSAWLAVCVLLVLLTARVRGVINPNQAPQLPPSIELILNDHAPLFLTEQDELTLRASARPGKPAPGTTLHPTAGAAVQQVMADAGTVLEWAVEGEDGVLLATASLRADEPLVVMGSALPPALFEQLPTRLVVSVSLVAGRDGVPPASAAAPVVLLDGTALDEAAAVRVESGAGFVAIDTPEGFPVGMSTVCARPDLAVACVVDGRVVCVETPEACRIRTRAFAGLLEGVDEVGPGVQLQEPSVEAGQEEGAGGSASDVFVSTEFEVRLTDRYVVQSGVLEVVMRQIQLLLPTELARGLALHLKTRQPISRFGGITASFFFVDLILVDLETRELVRDFGKYRVVINIAVDGSIDENDLQLGFFDPALTAWQVADPEVESVNPASVLLLSDTPVQVVRTVTSHFTSFAVLVAGSEEDQNRSHLDTTMLVIYILSGSLFVLVVLVSVIFIISVYNVNSLRRKVIPPGTSQRSLRTLRAMRAQRLSSAPDDEGESYGEAVTV